MYKKKSKLRKSYTTDAYKMLPLSLFSETVFGECAEDFDEILRHPNREDDFWNTRFGGEEARNALRHAKIPVLLVTGFYDIYTGGVFDIMIKVFAAALLLLGVLDFITLHWLTGTVKALLGAAVWFLSWKFLTVALYLAGGLLIVDGLLGLARTLHRRRVAFVRLSGVLASLICVAVGGFLLFGQGVVLPWVFTLTGVCLVISGILSLVK
jgi:hypothetical protein